MPATITCEREEDGERGFHFAQFFHLVDIDLWYLIWKDSVLYGDSEAKPNMINNKIEQTAQGTNTASLQFLFVFVLLLTVDKLL